MLEPDAHLGTYRLLGRLGAGGMGEVWKAEDTRLGRTVAIKILPPAVASDPDAMNRMRREARTAAQLYHPNIAMIHAFEEVRSGDSQGDVQLFIVMEFVEGEPLTTLMRRGPMAEAEVCRIGRSIADALAEAHAKEIVHRDIKPDNVIVNGPRVKVLDFGIAKRIGPEPMVGANDPTAFRTQTGFIIGTVNYMSPEQALGKTVDARTDIFSLGVVLYQALTGRLPFLGESVTETITLIVRDEPEALRGVSPGLEAIVRRCLAKKPEARFPTAREVADALEQQLGVAPTSPYTRQVPVASASPTVQTATRGPAPRRWPTFAAISALVIAGILSAIVLLRPKPQIAAPAPPAKPVTVSSAAAITTTIEVQASAPPLPPPPTVTTAVTIEQVDKPAGAVEKTANDFYNEGLARLVERQPFRARDSFESAVERDPNHAKAHFRLGEMALFGRDFAAARAELDKALSNRDQLDERERKLTELGLAVLDRDRVRAQELVDEISRISPRDPDLMRFRGLLEAGGQRQGGPLRGRRQKPR